MGKTLIIAEKPSVASDIARALGGFTRHGDYFESDRHVLSSAIGHLLEICPPEGFEAPRGKWTFTHLPVIPPEFALRPIERSEARLRLLEKLIKRKDVDALINACDAGREGELIFRHIAQHCRAGQPIQRLWLQSMTPAAIRDGFARLRTDREMLPLADAAVCRSESDWLVGINGTRAMTAFNSKTGGFHKTTVGRVQTPTLAIVVEREQRIRSFVSRDYWEVHGTFDAAAGSYPGRWFDEQFTKDKAPANGEKDEFRPERIWDQARAEAIRQKCLGKPGTVTEESKLTSQMAPLLYDLTSLQREANGRFGFPASMTLKLAQGLYERQKALTYPRTDSRALPEDYLATVKTTLEALAATPYAAFARQILKQDWVRPNKRVFNNAKISDHFAIIPTPQPPKNLTEAEQKLYDLVAKRFLAVFYPAAEFMVTTRITRVEDEPFKSEGKVMVQAGWLAVYGKEAQTDDQPNLPPVVAGEQVQTSDVRVEACQTKPPPRFTDATLLSAMEGAGKLVGDEELREAMADKGLGTPATRAATIDGLIYEQYLNRLGRELQPTAKAFSLIALLQGLGIPELSKPELTGDWEFKLRQIQRGQLSRPAFMAEIAEMTRQIVARAKGYEHDTIPGDFCQLETPCPKCGGVVKETYKKFQCSREGCDFALWNTVAGRQFEPAEIEELLARKVVGPLAGFRSKLGRPFSAVVRLTPEFKAEFDFGQNDKLQANGEAAPAPDFSAQEPLGKCPKCGGRVFEDTAAYVCEKAVSETKSCVFRSGKLILQQPVERAQMSKLLAEGRTDLLTRFISRKGRPFKAFLVVDKDGKVGFEFEKRAPKTEATEGREGRPKEPAAPLDFTGQEPVGPCPLCGARVFESAQHYLCEKSQTKLKPCKFKAGKVILQRLITRPEIASLLTGRRTELLTKFTSNKTGRTFSAHLVLGEEGKVGFEFAARAEKAE